MMCIKLYVFYFRNGFPVPKNIYFDIYHGIPLIKKIISCKFRPIKANSGSLSEGLCRPVTVEMLVSTRLCARTRTVIALVLLWK